MTIRRTGSGCSALLNLTSARDSSSHNRILATSLILVIMPSEYRKPITRQFNLSGVQRIVTSSSPLTVIVKDNSSGTQVDALDHSPLKKRL